jgi:uncharacterized membrane protein
MEKMFVVVFDEEEKALEGESALRDLDYDGDISVYAEAVVKKNADGSLTLEQSDNVYSGDLLVKGATDALLDLLGRSLEENAAENLLELERAGVSVDFLIDVSSKLKPGKWALVADATEEDPAPFEKSMKELGGSIFRISRPNVTERAMADLRNEVKELNKQERAEERQEKRAELHDKLEQSKLKLEQREQEAKAKVAYLEKKMKDSRAKAKTNIENRIHELRNKDSPSAEQTARA